MTSNQLAEQHNKKAVAVRVATKRAIDKGLDLIKLDGVAYGFELQTDGAKGGKYYEYTPFDEAKKNENKGAVSNERNKEKKSNSNDGAVCMGIDSYMDSNSSEGVLVGIEDIETAHRVKAVNELRSCPKGFSKTAWAKSIAVKYGVSAKTLYAWQKKYINKAVNLPDGLAERVDFKLVFNSSKFDVSALEWAVGFYIQNPLATKKRVYEELCKEAAGKGWAVGDYSSFTRQLDKNEMRTLLQRAIGGDREVRNTVAPFVNRDLNLYGSMEMIVGDQIVFDFKAYDPDGEIVNPNAYVWVDMGSGAIIGVDVVFGKYNRYCIGRSLKMALSFGMPDTIYTDNGRPELSKYITDIRSQLSGIEWKEMGDLDPRLVHTKARARNSRAKPIENIFNHIQRWMREDIFIEQNGRGYHRQDRSKEIIKDYAKKQLLSCEDFVKYFSRAVKKWNEHLNNARKIIPIESFLTKLIDSGRSRFDETTLEHIFAPRKFLQVRNSFVTLHHNKEAYQYAHPKLARYIKEKVEVRYDPNDKRKVTIINDKNELLCVAELNQKIDPRDYEVLKSTIAKNEKVVKIVREAFNYYKEMHKPNYMINNYSNVANRAKSKQEEGVKIKKNLIMSNKDILEAM